MLLHADADALVLIIGFWVLPGCEDMPCVQIRPQMYGCSGGDRRGFGLIHAAKTITTQTVKVYPVAVLSVYLQFSACFLGRMDYNIV